MLGYVHHSLTETASTITERIGLGRELGVRIAEPAPGSFGISVLEMRGDDVVHPLVELINPITLITRVKSYKFTKVDAIIDVVNFVIVQSRWRGRSRRYGSVGFDGCSAEDPKAAGCCAVGVGIRTHAFIVSGTRTPRGRTWAVKSCHIDKKSGACSQADGLAEISTYCSGTQDVWRGGGGL